MTDVSCHHPCTWPDCTAALHERIEVLEADLRIRTANAELQEPAQRLSDERIMKIVREASKGSALRRDGTTSMRIARAVEAAIVPPGYYVVVPMEPTQGMSRAGGMAVLRTYYAGPERSIHPEEDDVATATAAYRAMFAAAQKAQP